MALQFNQVTLAGNLTRDAQVRLLNGDKTVAQLGIAINRQWKSEDGQRKEEVTFVDLEVWGKQAEFAGQYLTKGAAVFIQGRLKLEQWDKDGVKHSKLKVLCDTIKFTESKRDGARPAAAAAAPADAATAAASSAPEKQAAPAGGGADDEPPF